MMRDLNCSHLEVAAGLGLYAFGFGIGRSFFSFLYRRFTKFSQRLCSWLASQKSLEGTQCTLSQRSFSG